MAGLPRIITRVLPEIPQTLGVSEPHLDRGRVADAFGLSTFFFIVVNMVPAAMPGTPSLRAVVGLTIAWMFSEIFTRYRGMAAPSVLFSIIYAEMALILAALMIPNVPMTDGIPNFNALVLAQPGALALACAAVGGAMILHYRLLRSPVDLAIAAIAFTAAVMLAGEALAPEVMRYTAHFVAAFCAWMTLCAGMLMDVADPHRKTRGSDVAFWLHLATGMILVYAIFACGGVLKEITVFASLTLFAIPGMAVNRYLILTLAKLGLVLVLAVAVVMNEATLGLMTLVPLGILYYAHIKRKQIRKRLIERTLPEIAPMLPPIDVEDAAI